MLFPAASRAVLEHRYVKAALSSRCHMAALAVVWHSFDEPQPKPIRALFRSITASSTTTADPTRERKPGRAR